MNCADAHEHLADYLYDELDAGIRGQVEAHVAACDACRDECASLRRTMDRLDDWPAPESAIGAETMAALVERDIKNQQGGSPWRGGWWRPALVGVAAALVGVVSLVYLLGDVRFDDSGLAVSFQVEASRDGPTDIRPGPTGEFLLVLYSRPRTWAARTPRRRVEIVEEYRQWAGQLAHAGHLIGGRKLAADGGRILMRSESRTRVTEAPYAGDDEVMTGFFHIRAASYREATAISQSCPHLEYGSRMELRRIEPTTTSAAAPATVRQG